MEERVEKFSHGFSRMNNFDLMEVCVKKFSHGLSTILLRGHGLKF